jgi:TRAP-type C4-dicarboxylate transport system permease small subunit
MTSILLRFPFLITDYCYRCQNDKNAIAIYKNSWHCRFQLCPELAGGVRFGLMKVRDVLNRVHFISAILASIFLAFQLVIISTNVIMRYFFASGISWMEEISSNVLMTAFTFLSMAIGVKLDLHINVNLFPKGTPQWVTTVLLKLKHLVLAVIGFVLLYYGILLIMGIKGSIASIPSLPASLQFIMIPLAGFLILVDSMMSLFGMEKDNQYLDRKLMAVGEKK